MKVKCFAKLNLSLNVYKKQGLFHPIDSIAVSVDIFDTISLTLRNDSEVTVSGTNIPLRQNTAYKAAVAFQRRFGTCGCDIAVEKHIPVGAGMGGSSADAVGVVYCLCKLHQKETSSEEVRQICAEVGSDVNMMLTGGLCRMKGKGDDVQKLPLQDKLFFAVTLFPQGVLSKDVFARWDSFRTVGASVDNDILSQVLCDGRVQEATAMFCNGLQHASQSFNDYAENYLSTCENLQLHPCMTGSGSAYFVAFERETLARNATRQLQQQGYNTILCQSVGCGVQIV